MRLLKSLVVAAHMFIAFFVSFASLSLTHSSVSLCVLVIIELFVAVNTSVVYIGRDFFLFVY